MDHDQADVPPHLCNPQLLPLVGEALPSKPMALPSTPSTVSSTGPSRAGDAAELAGLRLPRGGQHLSADRHCHQEGAHEVDQPLGRFSRTVWKDRASTSRRALECMNG